MKKLIVNSLETICKIVIIFLVGIAFFAGYQSKGVIAAVIFAVIVFLICVIIFGVLFILLDMNDNLRTIRRYIENDDFGPDKKR